MISLTLSGRRMALFLSYPLTGYNGDLEGKLAVGEVKSGGTFLEGWVASNGMHARA